ncbi:hypothetical protein [Kitasatospora purpeofusca]|uniref:hypothetical protein n=1 Tax=Kitasatospora purpeofusca TaxID=67352 RepID=UPI0037FF13AB
MVITDVRARAAPGERAAVEDATPGRRPGAARSAGAGQCWTCSGCCLVHPFSGRGECGDPVVGTDRLAAMWASLSGFLSDF